MGEKIKEKKKEVRKRKKPETKKHTKKEKIHIKIFRCRKRAKLTRPRK